MTIPSTNVTISSIRSEFGGPATNVSMSLYYRGGTYVPIGTPTSSVDGTPISTSSTIRIGMFRNITNAATGVMQNKSYIASDVDDFAPYSTSVGIRYEPNGTVIQQEVGIDVATYSGSNGWYNPTTTNIGSSYWIQFTLATQVGSGATLGGGLTLGTWYQLNTSRGLILSYDGSSVISDIRTFTVKISTNSSGTNVVATHTVQLSLATE